MTPDDLARFSIPSDPQLHPDGKRVAFVVTTMNLEEDRYDRRIWTWDGTTAQPFTAGPGDHRPRWSPDGTELAYLAEQDQGPPLRSAVRVIPAGGGESRLVVEFPLGAVEAEWSPIGDRLAVVGKEWVDEWADLDEAERAKKPRRIVRSQWRFDNKGWRHDRRSNVFVVDPSGSEPPTRVSSGDYHDTEVAWHPDGSRIAFLSARHERRGLDPGNQAWEVQPGAAPVPLVGLGRWVYVGYSPDGVAHLIGMADQWDIPAVEALYRIEGDGLLSDLTGHLDRSPMPLTPTVSPAGPQWIGTDFATVLEDDGRVRLVRVAPSGEVTELVGGDSVLSGASVRPDGSAASFVASTATNPGELYWWEDGEERPLTALNGAFRSEAGPIEPETFTFTREGVDITAWVYLPPGEDIVPLLLNIHGGPASQYGFGFFDEFQVYANAGYGVVACNPRGSSGRGREFVRSVVGKWTEPIPVDIGDLLAVVDEALRRFPRLDPERKGVMGGSYGGLATMRVTAADPSFRSAVVERALTSFLSFAGSSDIGPYFGKAYLGPLPHEDWQDHWAASPMAFAHRIDTPTLVLHAEDDYRCPIEQGEQLFALLQQRGIPSEMIRFPGEGHEMSRSGSPGHRRERFQAILAWHDRHLMRDSV